MLGMVFAAGLGTRLLPLTERLPKPAVPLVNRPLGAYSMERLAALGVTRCAVNLHHLADAAEAELSAHRPPSLELTFVREATLLGTGGGLRNAVERALAE
ncbi:MAG: sugar phosphate nucleotidyltransferase, partial [Sandaracinaceae bacterium]